MPCLSLLEKSQLCGQLNNSMQPKFAACSEQLHEPQRCGEVGAHVHTWPHDHAQVSKPNSQLVHHDLALHTLHM